MTATYVQAPTHKALLDGILIDNTRLGGFDPSRTEYSARVSNLDHWTVAAVFDKDSGMSVTIHKERAKATLTVTSADGLVSRVYVVNLTQDAVAGKGTDGVGVLSETGSNVTPALLATAGALLAGLAGLGLHGLVRRRRDLLPRVQAKRVRRCTRVHHEGKLLHGSPVVRIVREACPHGKAHSHADDHERATHEQEGPDGQHGQPELPSPHERSTSLATCPSTMRQLRSNSASSAGSL